MIGAKFGATVHVPSWREHSDAVVVALASRPDPSALARAGEIAAKNSIPQVFGSGFELIQCDQVDVVSIAVEPEFQPALIEECLRLKKPFFFEKPFGGDSRLARELALKAKELDVNNAMDFEFPSLSVWKTVREHLESSRLGTPLHFSCEWHLQTVVNRLGQQSWKTQDARGGGTLGNLGSHALFNVEWLLGRILELSAWIPEGHPAQLIALELKLENGIVGRVAVSANTPSGQIHEWMIYGSDASLALRNRTRDYMKGFEFEITANDGRPLAQGTLAPAELQAADGRVTQVSRQMGRLLRAIREGNGVNDLEVATRNEVLLEAARASSSGARGGGQGKWIKV